jgi:hypothetical protein
MYVILVSYMNPMLQIGESQIEVTGGPFTTPHFPWGVLIGETLSNLKVTSFPMARTPARVEAARGPQG